MIGSHILSVLSAEATKKDQVDAIWKLIQYSETLKDLQEETKSLSYTQFSVLAFVGLDLQVKRDNAKEIFESLDREGKGYLIVGSQKVTCLDFCRIFNIKVPFIATRHLSLSGERSSGRSLGTGSKE